MVLKVKKVRWESMLKVEEVLKSVLKLQKVWESVSKAKKVCQKLRKYDKSWESMTKVIKFEIVYQKLWKYEKVC